MIGLQQNIKEQGQIIVIVAFLLVAMIAMLGLAIDVGGLFFLQRDTQNALDHAVIAATYARCSADVSTPTGQAQVINAAKMAAADHGFEDGVDGVTVTVTIGPSVSPINGNDEYVEVIISAPKESYFIQIVNVNNLAVSSRGVGHCNPDVVTQHIKAMTGLGQCGFTVSTAGGSAQMNIWGGGIFSNDAINTNSNVHLDPSPHTVYGSPLPTHGAHTPSADVTYDNWSSSMQFGGSPPPTTDLSDPVDFPLLYDIADYQPGGDIAVAAGSDYHSFIGNVNIPADIALDGLIYATGTITVSVKDLPAQPVFTVTLVTLNGMIDFKQSGGAGVTVVTTSYTETLGINDYLLAFTMAGSSSPACSTQGISFSGDDWISRGVMYAPYQNIFWSMSNSYFEGAIIGYSIDIRGAQHDIHFMPDMIPPLPPTIEISE